MFLYYYLAPLAAVLVYFILNIPMVREGLAREICNENNHIVINGLLIFSAAFIVMLCLPFTLKD